MQLADYLSRHGLTHQAFADLIGTTQVSVGRYIRGQRFPCRGVLARIKEVTGGAVTPDDFVAAAESRAVAAERIAGLE